MLKWNVNAEEINRLRHICQVLAKQNTAGPLKGRITETIVSQVLTLDTNYLKSHRGSEWPIVGSDPSDWSEDCMDRL